ncbi:hypothetical protein [Streptomyces sp. NPDC003032]
MHWRARIGTVDGVPRGAGVLVDGARLITCAHVVEGLSEVRVTLPGVELTKPLSVPVPVPVSPCVFAPLDLLRPREGRSASEHPGLRSVAARLARLR